MTAAVLIFLTMISSYYYEYASLMNEYSFLITRKTRGLSRKNILENPREFWVKYHSISEI
ncbi:MAG: hypothetical protein DRH26_15325 [Deltaproteobacteria bacterium]|nr:MAG: hypothetical protein DRH26_15325 [Deltaproteobacteria bacterium]